MAEEARALFRAALERHAQLAGERAAISERAADGSFRTTSYRELRDKVEGYERLLRSLPEPAQLVPLCLARGVECAAAMLGALLAGQAFCCLNPKLRLPQIERILEQLNAPLALTDAHGLLALRGEPRAASALYATRWRLVLGPPLTRAAQRVYDELARRTEVAPALPLTEAASAALTETSVGNASDLGCCLFTSGSTGAPKGVLVAASDLLARARGECELFELGPSDVVLNVLPFSFDVGLNQLLATLLVGAELVVLDSWLPADILNAVASRAVTGISAVPAIWSDFMAKGRSFDRAGAHRSLRYLTVSGGDLTPAQHDKLRTLAAGVSVIKTYGQTEAFRIAALPPTQYGQKRDSVGKALTGGNLYVVRPDLSQAEVGELGEVVHTGVGTMLGYLDGDSDHGQQKLRPNPFRSPRDPNPRALFTGDFGRIDGEGYLQLAGRRDDLLKVAGNRVYPGEVKALLTQLPAVANAEVVAVEQDGGPQLAAFVLPEAGALLEAGALRRALQERAPSYMVPALVTVCSELPRTATGKIDRTSLAARAQSVLDGRADKGAHLWPEDASK